MDRLVQTALVIRQMQDNKFDLPNLANVNVPGFRRDLPNEGNAGFLQELETIGKGYLRRMSVSSLMKQAQLKILVSTLTSPF